MARCPNCGRDSSREFCETCGEYVGVPAERATGAPDPEPVLPARVVPRPVLRRLPEVDRDVRCAACGAYGPSGRTFCGHCGADASAPAGQAAGVAARPPWWRRSWRRPAIVTGPVGPQRVLRAPRDRRGGVAVAVVAAAVGLAAIAPFGRTAYRAVTGRYEPVRASAASGAAVRGHPAARLIDGIVNASWIGPAPAPRGIVLLVSFPGPVDVDRIGLTQGAGEQPEWYARYARVARLALAFDDGTTATVSIVDEPGFHAVAVRARGVRSVRMTVVSTYPGAGPRYGPALSEVEFFRLG